jgi:H+/Cl- antiporter ClcA
MFKLKEETKLHFGSSLSPSLCFGAISGAGASLVVTLFQFFSRYAVDFSKGLYYFLHQIPWFFPLVLILLLFLSHLLSLLYRKEPDLQGGGIPVAVGVMRGLFSLHAIPCLIGTFFVSLLSFLLGVPLGTEGPAVQMGTAVGSALVEKCGKKWRAWKRFAITGGASAGFATCTGAPLSGILFSIEEAHGRISPLIVLTAIVSVLTGGITSRLLGQLLGVGGALFHFSHLPALPFSHYYLPLLTGICLGLFSLLFLSAYKAIHKLIQEKGKKLSHKIKIFSVFSLTLLAGFLSFSFISTGHDLVEELSLLSPGIPMLLLVVCIRSLLTLSATSVGITGGIFLPMIAIGASLAAVLANLLCLLGMDPAYFVPVIAFGICGCISGMMKMPLTAIPFSVEILGLSENLLAVILCAAVSFLIPEMLGFHSIGELVLERRIEHIYQGKTKQEGETEIEIEAGSFAVGKEVRDIFWPDGVWVLSVIKKEKSPLLQAGDRLLIRYNTFQYQEMEQELSFIVSQ